VKFDKAKCTNAHYHTIQYETIEEFNVDWKAKMVSLA